MLSALAAQIKMLSVNKQKSKSQYSYKNKLNVTAPIKKPTIRHWF